MQNPELPEQIFTNKNAVIYARVSSKEQEQEGYSIPAQLKLLRPYALKNDLIVVKTLIDGETVKKAVNLLHRILHTGLYKIMAYCFLTLLD